MKNLNFFSILIGIFIGIITTIVFNKFLVPSKNYSAFPGNEIKLKEITKSESDKAIYDYKSFIKNNTSNDTCNYKYAINVSKQQYQVMYQAISRMNQQQINAISGFRLYFSRIPPNNELFSYLVYIDNDFMERNPTNGGLSIASKTIKK